MNGDERCENCRFWFNASRETERDGGELSEFSGLCRRYPPQMLSINSSSVDDFIPSTTSNEWCGEWQQIDIKQDAVDDGIKRIHVDELSLASRPAKCLRAIIGHRDGVRCERSVAHVLMLARDKGFRLRQFGGCSRYAIIERLSNLPLEVMLTTYTGD